MIPLVSDEAMITRKGPIPQVASEGLFHLLVFSIFGMKNYFPQLLIFVKSTLAIIANVWTRFKPVANWSFSLRNISPFNLVVILLL